MGQKTHPIGFRLGVIKDWQSRWFAAKQADYRKLVLEDLAIRNAINSRYRDAGVSRIEIERPIEVLKRHVELTESGVGVARLVGQGGEATHAAGDPTRQLHRSHGESSRSTCHWKRSERRSGGACWREGPSC